MPAEPLNFLAGTCFFVHGFVRAVLTYAKDAKATWPTQAQTLGRGLHAGDTLPDKLPSIVEIKRAIPARCFQPTVATSMYYAAKDIVLVALTYAAFVLLVEKPLLTWAEEGTSWARVLYGAGCVVYWGVQGTLFTAIFVIGHDCGHGSFSRHSLLNDAVGHVFHCFLLTPYYMWKLSHRHHHKFTGNMDKDEVFYPVRESEPCAKNGVPPGFGLGIGWLSYLVTGYSPRNVGHFNPFDAMFSGHVGGCVATLAVLAGWAWCLASYTAAWGVWALACHYLVPLSIFCCYIVIITFLHHHEWNIPWYADSEWDYVKGQLSTVDRNYGYVHDIIHNIGTHQMHHMFSKVPHYHLEEATRHFREAFPGLVRCCSEPIMPAFWRMFAKYAAQSVVGNDARVHYYT